MLQEQFNFLFSESRKLMYKTKDPNHNWGHIERVLENIDKIKMELPKNLQMKLDDHILKLAAAWHDISFVFYKINFRQFFYEGRRSVKIIKKYFSERNVLKEEIDLICDIVKNHTGGAFGRLNKQRSIYHQIIQDADTIDIFNKDRCHQAEKAAEHGLWFWKFVIKIYKPLTYNWYLKHYEFIYNFSDIIRKLDKEEKIVISH